MCTVTIVPEEGGFRLACNRDERRDRVAACPPRLHHDEERAVIYPVDPVGGGTWVGVNDRGLAAALLNRSCRVDARPVRSTRSRGLIIPPLLRRDGIEGALEDARGLDPAMFLPFRLLLVQQGAGAMVASNGHALQVQALDLSRPCLVTSSSLGDALVDGPRRRLFSRMFRRRDRWLASQARFHAHQWRSRPEWSVLMERHDARTVSRTFVRVGAGGAQMDYEANPALSFAQTSVALRP